MRKASTTRDTEEEAAAAAAVHSPVAAALDPRGRARRTAMEADGDQRRRKRSGAAWRGEAFARSSAHRHQERHTLRVQPQRRPLLPISGGSGGGGGWPEEETTAKRERRRGPGLTLTLASRWRCSARVSGTVVTTTTYFIAGGVL